MEGRHVGLDFYDLLIEAIEAAAVRCTLSVKQEIDSGNAG